MKYILWAVLILTVLMCGCGNNNKDTEPEGNWSEAIYLKLPGRPMVYLEGEGPCQVSYKDNTVFEGLKTGDVLKVKWTLIQESYPAQMTCTDVVFVRSGGEEEIEKVRDTIDKLADLGWMIETGEE